MKKILIASLILMSSFTQAQQEVKLDIADALVLKTIEVSYEYYLDEQSSIGVSALFSFEKQSADFRYNEDRMITPFYRHYFTSDRSWNFFGEGFLGISSGVKTVETFGGADTYANYSDGAFGVAAGLKYISTNGLTIDAYAGVGRNLFSENSPIIVPRFGVNIGKRF